MSWIVSELRLRRMMRTAAAWRRRTLASKACALINSHWGITNQLALGNGQLKFTRGWRHCEANTFGEVPMKLFSGWRSFLSFDKWVNERQSKPR